MQRWVFACALALVACGGNQNELSGSISESFSLEFDKVAIRKQSTDLIIEYLKNVSGGTAKVCKLVVDTHNLALKSDTNLTDDTFMSRVTVSRVASSGGDFPPVKHGKVHFDDYEFEAGGLVSGQFDIVFDNGRTVHGDFSGTVEDVPVD